MIVFKQNQNDSDVLINEYVIRAPFSQIIYYKKIRYISEIR